MIDWNAVHHFKPSEFSESPDEFLLPITMYNLEKLRIAYNKSVYPSPVVGALARLSGSKKSQHYCGVNDDGLICKSCAVDVFPEGLPVNFFVCVLNMNIFKGIGVYLDTTGIDGKPWIMFHLDNREHGFNTNAALIWIAEKVKCPDTGKIKTKYRYPQMQPQYWKLLQDKKLYIGRRRGA